MFSRIIGMTTLVHKALRYAQQKHLGQKRKVTGADYVTHPIMVSYLATTYKCSKAMETLVCAAILHDTIEDTEATYEELLDLFGMPIASLVFELTSDHDAIKVMGKLEYLKTHMAGMSSYALFLKLCDRLANILDNPSDKQIKETTIILEHLKGRRQLSASHQVVISEIEKVIRRKSEPPPNTR